MTESLKSCPFCGGTANIAKGIIEFWAYCPHCGAKTELYETKQKAADAWNRQNETELVKQFIINNDKNLIVKFERSEPNARMSFPIRISYNFYNIRDLNDVEKEVLSKLLTDVRKNLCDGVPYESSSYSCRACESATAEREKELLEKIKKLRKALAFYAELDGNGIQLYGYMDSKALEFDDGESFPFGKKARDALKGAENDTKRKNAVLP